MRLLSILFGFTRAIDWLSFHQDPTKGCDNLRSDGERAGRLHFCQREEPLLIQAVVTAAVQTKHACEKAMHDKRWDCTSLEHAPKFKRDLRKGTQERAFVHSLSSAAVAINVARVCALGVLKDCNCAHRPQDDDLDENKVSRPCEHDLDFAAKWAGQWTSISAKFDRKRYQPMIKQDNGVGRRVAMKKLPRKICKCHGPSGSCTQQTCWRVAPDIDTVAEELKKLYTSAVSLPKERHGRNAHAIVMSRNQAPITRHSPQMATNALQMVYVDKSHDYCEKNAKEGSTGTQGRECNPNGTGSGSCNELCCGRGYQKRSETRVNTQHNCRYVWCCRVECETITEVITKFVCR